MKRTNSSISLPAIGQSRRSSARNRTLRVVSSCAIVVGAIVAAMPVQAQFEDNPVYVDDSPRAWELFRRAEDQRKDNPSEAARLYQELLTTYPLKLIPRSANDDDHLVAVRTHVHLALLEVPDVLDRYRMMQTAAAQRLLDRGNLREVWSSMFLTKPALDATLRLAQAAVEDARFNEAIRLLLEAANHPDLSGRESAHRWLLLGLAANNVGSMALRDEAVQALAVGLDTDSRVCHAELMRLLRGGPGPTTEHGVNSLTVGPPVALESFVDEPIWTVPLDESPFSRQFSSPDGRQQRITSAAMTARSQGLLLSTLPTVAGRSIYINEGQVIRALDRFSVREFWRQEIRGAGVSRGPTAIGDLNAIAIDGDRLVTLTGHASSQSRLWQDRVVCLNKYTGELAWDIDFDRDLGGDEYDDLFPHGAPLIFDGTVYVMARRVSRQLLISNYVVALDLAGSDDDQRVRWVQYVASSAGIQQGDPKPYGTLAMANGDLFLSTSLGAVARLDAMSGEVRWLKRLPVPFRAVANVRPWGMSAPVVSDAQVIAVDPSGGVVVLDREKGNELARYQARTWGGPRYLLAARGLVFAIGISSLYAFSTESLDFPLWRLGEGGMGPTDFDILGRVQLTDGMLVVPTNRGLLFVDAETGLIERTVPMTEAGNPLAYGPELYIAYSDRLEAYMPLSVAESMLREQIASSPHNPEPSLSLLRLAARSAEAAHACELALEAAASTMKVLERLGDTPAYEPAQSELFSTLVQIAQRGHEARFDVASALHGTISSIAIGPSQRIEQLLVRGEWLQQLAQAGERQHLAPAVEAFQTILSDGELAATDRRNADVVRTSRFAATEKIAEMIGLFGTDVYAPQSSDAARRLASLPGAADPVELIAICRQFPHAPAADTAALLAADLLLNRSRSREALSLLVERCTVRGSDVLPIQLVERIIGVCLEEDWSALGGYWLEVAEARHGRGLVLTIEGEGIGFPELRSRLGGLVRPDLPVIGRISSESKALKALPGRLVLPDRPNRRMQPDHALLIDGQTLSRVDGLTLDIAWRANAVSDVGQLLFDDGSRIVVRYPAAPGIIVQYDAGTGAELWRSGSVELELPQLRPDLRTAPLPVQIPGEDSQQNRFSSIARMCGDDSVIAIGRSAGMARYRFDHPNDEPLWAVDHGMDLVHHADIHDLGLVVCGEELRQVRGGSRPVGMVAIFDPRSGAEMARFTTLDEELVWWTSITPAGLLTYRTEYAIESVDLASLTRSWSHINGAATWAERSWLFGERLIIADGDSRTGAIRLADGGFEETFQPEPELNWSPRGLSQLHLIGAFAVARYRGKIVIFDPAGGVHGQDVAGGSPGDGFTNLVAGAEMLFVVSHQQGGRGRAPRSRFSNTVFTFDRSARTVSRGTEIPTGRDKLRGATGITGWLLLGEADQVLAIPSVDLFQE